MSVELPPTGTFGWKIPKPARRLTSRASGFGYALYRLLGGRTRVLGLPLLLLTTVGARSGRRRRIMLQCYPEGDEAWLVVASGAGSASHPAWLRNMAKHPDEVWIDVGRYKVKVRPAVLDGAEREEAWRRIVSVAPVNATFQEKTDRVIPVVRLMRSGQTPDVVRAPAARRPDTKDPSDQAVARISAIGTEARWC